MWKAFWGNCGHAAAKQAPVAAKCILLDRVCKSVLSYRCSRWPPQPVIAAELDRVQTKMIASILRTARFPGEPIEDFCRRRNRSAAEKCRQHGLWSKHWFKRASDWDKHLERAHNERSWPVMLRPFHDAIWLEEQRVAHNMSGTQTRVMPGRPRMRWDDGIWHAAKALAS